MAKKSNKAPEPDRKALIPLLRDVMATAPARKWSEAMLHKPLNELAGYPVSSEDLKYAIDRNADFGFITYKHDHELGRDLWFFTDRGLEAIKE